MFIFHINSACWVILHTFVVVCWLFSFGNTEYQTVWIQIGSDILLVLIWVQIVCKRYQQRTKVTVSKERVKQFLSFCRMPWKCTWEHTRIFYRMFVTSVTVGSVRRVLWYVIKEYILERSPMNVKTVGDVLLSTGHSIDISKLNVSE